MRKLLLSVATVLVFAAAPAAAQDGGKSVLDLPEGQALVNLSATERVTVQQDLLVATLNYEAESKNPRDLQNEINGLMKKALEKAKSYKDVKVSTQQYYVYAYEPPVPVPGHLQNENIKREKLWRGSQGLHLESKSADDLLELTGILQDMGLVMNGLNYTISTELLETTHESLMEAALSKLKAKAERAAKALGKSKADLIEINVDSGGQYYPPMPMMKTMAMGAEMAAMDAPSAAPGESDITMTVSARALLKP
ncbi:MAG: SIMPL domain-containing protein [Proteobacteria bacterium]|nr:SIMPL domain-containing protein [Pseudomonadota bacterium]